MPASDSILIFLPPPPKKKNTYKKKNLTTSALRRPSTRRRCRCHRLPPPLPPLPFPASPGGTPTTVSAVSAARRPPLISRSYPPPHAVSGQSPPLRHQFFQLGVELADLAAPLNGIVVPVNETELLLCGQDVLQRWDKVLRLTQEYRQNMLVGGEGRGVEGDGGGVGEWVCPR